MGQAAEGPDPLAAPYRLPGKHCVQGCICVHAHGQLCLHSSQYSTHRSSSGCWQFWSVCGRWLTWIPEPGESCEWIHWPGPPEAVLPWLQGTSLHWKIPTSIQGLTGEEWEGPQDWCSPSLNHLKSWGGLMPGGATLLLIWAKGAVHIVKLIIVFYRGYLWVVKAMLMKDKCVCCSGWLPRYTRQAERMDELT